MLTSAEGGCTPSASSIRSPGPARIAAAIGAAAVIGYPLCPAPLTSAYHLIIVLTAAAAAAVGARRRRHPSLRGPVGAIVAATGYLLAAAVAQVVLIDVDLFPPNLSYGLMAVLHMGGSALLGSALLRCLGRRRAAEIKPAQAAALRAGIVSALAMAAFVLLPQFQEPPDTVVLLLTAVPAADGGLVTVMAMLIMAGGRRSTALWILAAATATQLVGGLLDALHAARHGTVGHPSVIADMGFLAAPVALGAAMLHPTLDGMDATQPARVGPVNALYIAGISTLITAPIAVGVMMPMSYGWGRLAQAATAAAVILTVQRQLLDTLAVRREPPLPTRARNSKSHRGYLLPDVHPVDAFSKLPPFRAGPNRS